MPDPDKPLNIIALTQGGSIDIFLNVIDNMAATKGRIGKIGALVSFARHFKNSRIVKNFPHEIDYIKEWKVTDKALSEGYDKNELRTFENALAPASVWNAILADRRLIYGRRSKYTQDYRVHYTDEQLWAIAYQFIVAFEALLDRIQPDVIIGFTPVTFGEMLGLEIAQSRGIPVLHLHSSRIQNYFSLHDVVYGTSSHFHALMQKKDYKEETKALTNEVIEEATKNGLLYEGVDIAISKGRPLNLLRSLKPLAASLYIELKRFIDPELRRDRHDPGALMPWFYQYWHQPLRERIIKMRLSRSKRVVTAKDLQSLGEYCFYPLHSEPEVALQVLGRPYHKNQIELMRNLAASLPAGMKLLVKEHPRSMGLRPYSYYKAMFEIPNLVLVDAHSPSQPVVQHSKMVAVISGTIGFEAIMMQKPVMLLGHPKYEGIRGRMTAKCYDLFDLPNAIRCLLSEYHFDRDELESFINATIEGSVPIDLYSNLLKKPGRHSLQDGKVSAEEDLHKLSEYIIKRINEALSA